MSSLTTWFGWSVASSHEELPEIFPIAMRREDFIKTDVVEIFKKILTDVVERTQGLKDDLVPLLWDNCLKSSSPDGLITMLAKAMSDKKELYLVYDKAVGVVREATFSEASQIKEDYKAKAESSVGVYVSFKNYVRSDMIKLYSGLEFCTVGALNKAMNLSTAIQIKINDLRASVSLGDSAEAKRQALEIAKSLSNGKDVYLDAKDSIENSMPDLTSVKASIEFLDAKRSFYLGLPAAYINGEQTGGLGTTGENDTKAIERGLKAYYFSIIKPTIEAVFGVKLSYKSQDFRQVTQALEAVKTFELVGEDMLTIDQKRLIVCGLLDIEVEATGEATPDPVPIKPVPGAPVPPAKEPKQANA